jgi:hypothetical protein
VSSEFLLALVLGLAGCLDEGRLNARCELTGDPVSGVLDMRNGADRRHLAEDLRIAGEVAVRHGDSAIAHAGIPGSVQIRFECLGRLHALIQAQHGVTAADIESARRMRDFWPDAALVYLPFGLLLYFVSARLSRRKFRRLPPRGERRSVLLNVAWMAVFASAVGTVVTHLHSWNVDAARLRNFHLSFRAMYLPIAMHPWRAYLVAVLICAIAAWRQWQVARRRPIEEGPGAGEWWRS